MLQITFVQKFYLPVKISKTMKSVNLCEKKYAKQIN